MASAYGGFDTPNAPDRFRFHSDNSILIRYYQSKKPKSFFNRAAFCLTGDIGFENGNGVTPFGGVGGPGQNFLSGMFYHRMWFANNKLGWTFGGGYINNPGRYLALLPTGNGVLTQNPGDQFEGWDVSTNLQWMPNEYTTIGLEFVHRWASAPYFSGPGGVTSPNGWNIPIGNPVGYAADLRQDENRIILSSIFRF